MRNILFQFLVKIVSFENFALSMISKIYEFFVLFATFLFSDSSEISHYSNPKILCQNLEA